MAESKLSLGEYMSKLSITSRDAWVVKKMLRADAMETRTEKQWDRIFKNKVKKISFEKQTAKTKTD